MAQSKKQVEAQKLISIRVPADVLEKPKERALMFGLPYQTFMKLLIEQGHAYIDQHGSLSVPVRNAAEERALRTAQRKVELAHKRATGELTTPDPEEKAQRKRKKKEQEDFLDEMIAERTAENPEFPKILEEVRQRRKKSTASALGAEPMGEFPTSSGAPGAAEMMQEHLNGVHASQEGAQAEEEAFTARAEEAAQDIEPMGDAPDTSEQEVSGSEDHEPLDLSHVQALVQSIGRDGKYDPFARKPVETITPEDAALLRQEPKPILVPDIRVEEAPLSPEAQADLDAGLESARRGEFSAPLPSPEKYTREETLAWSKEGEPAPSVLGGNLALPDEEVRAALAEMEALFEGTATLDAKLTVEAPKLEVPIPPPMPPVDTDLEELLAMI